MWWRQQNKKTKRVYVFVFFIFSCHAQEHQHERIPVFIVSNESECVARVTAFRRAWQGGRVEYRSVESFDV